VRLPLREDAAVRGSSARFAARRYAGHLGGFGEHLHHRHVVLVTGSPGGAGKQAQDALMPRRRAFLRWKANTLRRQRARPTAPRLKRWPRRSAGAAWRAALFRRH